MIPRPRCHHCGGRIVLEPAYPGGSYVDRRGDGYELQCMACSRLTDAPALATHLGLVLVADRIRADITHAQKEDLVWQGRPLRDRQALVRAERLRQRAAAAAIAEPPLPGPAVEEPTQLCYAGLHPWRAATIATSARGFMYCTLCRKSR